MLSIRQAIVAGAVALCAPLYASAQTAAEPELAPAPTASDAVAASQAPPAVVSLREPASAGVGDGIDDARRTLEAYLSETRSLRADFRSRLLDEQRMPLAESSGVVMVKRPNRFRWEYREPNPSLILADGERLWSYDADLEQAVVRDMADLEGANPSNLLGGDGDVEEDFEILGQYRAAGIAWVELRPRSGDSDFTKVRLGFVDAAIKLMELHDQLGQITQIELSVLEANPDLDDQLFRFEPPPGVDVVGAQ